MGSPSPLCAATNTPTAACTPREPYARALTLFPTIYNIHHRIYLYIYIYFIISPGACIIIIIIDLILTIVITPPTVVSVRMNLRRVAPLSLPHHSPLARRKTSLSHYFPATTIRLNYLRVLYTHTPNRHEYRAGL